MYQFKKKQNDIDQSVNEVFKDQIKQLNDLKLKAKAVVNTPEFKDYDSDGMISRPENILDALLKLNNASVSFESFAVQAMKILSKYDVLRDLSKSVKHYAASKDTIYADSE